MTKNNWIITAVVLLASVSMASAAAVQHDITFGPTPTGNASYPLLLPQFDITLGTLNSVTLMLDVDTDSGSIAWDNEAGSPSDVTLGIGAEVTATGPATLVVVVMPLQTGSAIGIAADEVADGAGDFLGLDAFSVTGGSGNDSDNTTLFSGFGAYIGTGTFSTTISSGVSTSLSTSGGWGPINPSPGQFDGTLSVIYDYTVPEPATMSLLAVGGLAALRRRRRKIA